MDFLATPAFVLLLTLLILTLLLTLLYVLRARSGRFPTFRPLPGIADLRARFGAVAEEGRPLHVATGTNQATVGTITPSAESIASLLIAQRVAEETARRGGTVAATSGDIVGHTALRGTIHSAHRAAGFGGDYDADRVQLVAQNTPVAYAAGVAARYETQPVAASVVAGAYGAEALLITEEGAARNVPQLAAAASLTALPVLQLSADATLIGEELFVAEAYLSDAAGPKARILTVDALRWVVLVLLVVGLIWQLLALFVPALGLPALQ
jgi:hypothetical protein